ncbi:Flagellar basal-body rod protein FlgB [hydrothermal vent metagenome]|uniref:Flagellar basal-body rod protein FlgB n=1 Tax=hydrothermal vent metagenome TaxID=652676 RepID=A0A3B1C6P1_9ZZZZ
MGDIYKIREFGYMQKALDGLVARQNAVTANIANAETPGYKAAKVDFEKNLASAIGQGFAMKETHPNHMPTKGRGVYGVTPDYTVNLSGAREDGNTVNLETEVMTSTETSLKFQTITSIFRRHLGMILEPLKAKGR